MNSNALMPFTLYGQNGAAERADQLTKLEVALQYGLSTRDLRVFDIPTSGFSHILVRHNTILIHMFDLRLLIQADRLLVFRIQEEYSHGHGHGHGFISTTLPRAPEPGDGIDGVAGSITSIPFTDSTTFDTGDEERTVSRVFTHDLEKKIGSNNHRGELLHRDGSENGGSQQIQQQRQSQPEYLHHQLPFELRVVEAALSAVVSVLEAEYLITRGRATKELNMTKSDQLDSYESIIEAELGKSLALTRKLSGIEQCARQVRDAVGDVLNEDYQLVNMHLTGKREGKPRSDHDRQDVEYLLESYFKASDAVVQEAAALVDNIRREEENVQSTLRVRRNQIMVLEAKIEVFMLAISTAALIASWFGMNVKNYVEPFHATFVVLVSISMMTMVAGSIFGLRRLHYISKLRV